MTPAPTKVALVATLALTAVALAVIVRAQRAGTLETDEVASVLWLLTGLFLLRVLGQIAVPLRAPSWLPPMVEWNLVPYRLLLPVQLAILGVMTWIGVSFSTSSGPPVDRVEVLGWAVLAFSAVYAGGHEGFWPACARYLLAGLVVVALNAPAQASRRSWRSRRPP
jgi:hypothetical protein